MQLRDVRRALAVLALAVPLAGCQALGLGAAATPSASVSPTPTGESWTVVVPGSATPSAPTGGVPRPSSPAPSFPSGPPHGPCAQNRMAGQVMIPLSVVPARGALTVTWPRYGSNSGYRVAAVPQKLVNGNQPPVAWKRVPDGAGCTVTTTIAGLTSGDPYVVWLDAPDTGYLRDGARQPYSGASGVVYPG